MFNVSVSKLKLASSKCLCQHPTRFCQVNPDTNGCSRTHMEELDLKCLKDSPSDMSVREDHNIYGDNPGQDERWDGDRQCQMLMFTNDAHMDHTQSDMKNICYSMKCRSPGRRGYYRAGPALEGTPCGQDMICHASECVKNNISPGVTNTAIWSDWASGTCQSGCITRSKGFSIRTRTCKKNSPVSFKSICPGNDNTICCLFKRRLK